MPPDAFPLRTVHLDFHTSPDIRDVGAEFNPEEFAQTFADAHIDSVTLFAKCHHGMLYYDTDHPARHPGLPRNLHLLEEQVQALHERGIRAPIYLSLQVDEYAARHHPEWVARDAEGRLVGPSPLKPGWHTMDMSSPYQEYLADQIAEVLAKFAPVDGIFLDMCWDQPSCSPWAMDGMKRRGYDPADETDRRQYAREVTHGYMERFSRRVAEALRPGNPQLVWFNSRPKTQLHIEKQYLRHIEVECLPTGGWGYAYFPYVARFVRPLAMPTLSHTGRFHRSWGDFGGLKPEAAMLYECASILSQGMSNGIGDQLHPRGKPDRAVYAQIGRVYGHVKACEPYVTGGRLLSQIGVIVNPERGDQPGPDGLGIIRMLQQLRHQFDFLPPGGDLSGYEVILVPESVRVDADLKARLQAYRHNGGALVLSGTAALDERGEPLLDDPGFTAHGESPYTTMYLQAEAAVAEGLPAMEHVMYERGLRLKPAGDAELLCRVVEPYFERSYEHFCSHNQTPPDRDSGYAAIVQQGRTLTFAAPIFTAYGKHGNLPLRQLFRNCLDRLLPEPLIRDGGPGHLEATVVEKDGRTVVHLLSFSPSRRTPDLDLIEDPIPLVAVPLSVKLDREPKRVFLVPSGDVLDWTYEGGRAGVSVSSTGGHVMVVFE